MVAPFADQDDISNRGSIPGEPTFIKKPESGHPERGASGRQLRDRMVGGRLVELDVAAEPSADGRS
jgi:hypothetical protein